LRAKSANSIWYKFIPFFCGHERGSLCGVQGWRSLRAFAQGHAGQRSDRSAELACEIRVDADHREIEGRASCCRSFDIPTRSRAPALPLAITLVVIPNGVDEPTPCDGEIATGIEGIVAEQPLVLFLGRLSWKKGLDRLLRAFASTRTGKLAIVGTDDEGLAPRLVKLARSLRMRSGFVSCRTAIGFEKERLFAAAHVFVLTSYSENFGNAVLEAMRRRVPVVVTPEVGVADIVRESRGGLVVAGDAICRLTPSSAG
jgi:glycosyltransferase involved in cell wall biosynthesis